jgi:CheY-like chemotaxis protein
MSPSIIVSLRRGGRPLRVLVVDDDAYTRQMLGEALQLFGAEVRTADSAAAARERIEDFAPDIVVSDVGMPQESGYELIRKLRALPRHRGGNTPAIAFTGYSRAEDRERALGAGYQDVVPKPVDLHRLLESIARLSGTARRPQRARLAAAAPGH